jgi:hypothetical protein
MVPAAAAQQRPVYHHRPPADRARPPPCAVARRPDAVVGDRHVASDPLRAHVVACLRQCVAEPCGVFDEELTCGPVGVGAAAGDQLGEHLPFDVFGTHPRPRRQPVLTGIPTTDDLTDEVGAHLVRIVGQRAVGKQAHPLDARPYLWVQPGRHASQQAGQRLVQAPHQVYRHGRPATRTELEHDHSGHAGNLSERLGVPIPGGPGIGRPQRRRNHPSPTLQHIGLHHRRGHRSIYPYAPSNPASIQEGPAVSTHLQSAARPMPCASRPDAGSETLP